MMEFVSWDDEIPNVGKNKKIMFQTTNHPSCPPSFKSGYNPI